MFKSSDLLSLNADSCVNIVKGFLDVLVSSILASDKDFASFSVLSTRKSSPDFAAPFIPKISTGVDGKASSICFPVSSIMALTLPHFVPQTK